MPLASNRTIHRRVRVIDVMMLMLLDVGAAISAVFLLTWLTMRLIATITDVIRGKRPHFSVRRLLVYMTAIAVVLALATALIQDRT
jgi:low affinity Fe/Cu permease